MYGLIEKLEQTHRLDGAELLRLLRGQTPELQTLLAQKALAVRKKIYGDKVCIRGLIEFTNYCKNDCFYCGIRRSNKNAERYRLTKEEILSCCEKGNGRRRKKAQ